MNEVFWEVEKSPEPNSSLRRSRTCWKATMVGSAFLRICGSDPGQTDLGAEADVGLAPCPFGRRIEDDVRQVDLGGVVVGSDDAFE